MAQRAFLTATLLICFFCCLAGCRTTNPYGAQGYHQPVLQQQSYSGVGQFNRQPITQGVPQFGRQVGRRFMNLVVNRGLNQVINGLFGG